MSKEMKDESSGVNWTYGGGEEEWDAFDRRMVRYMRGKLDVFGERLWKGEIEDLSKLAKQEFANYVLMVYESLRIAQPKLAKELKRKAVAEKFNGNYVMAWTGLTGKDLGNVLGRFRLSRPQFDEYVLNTSIDQIERDFHEFNLNQK